MSGRARVCDTSFLKLPYVFWTVFVKMSLHSPELNNCFSVYFFKFQTLHRMTPVDIVTVYSDSCKNNVKIAFSSNM